MEKRRFIQLAGFTSIGLFTGVSLLASMLMEGNSQIIEIQAPNIHVRHGNFNLQVANQQGLQIQRDIFNKNGLLAVTTDRMVSIKISDEQRNVYGVNDKNGFYSKSKYLSAIDLQAKESSLVNISSPCILFAEFGDLIVNGKVVKNHQAFYLKSSENVSVLSEVDQSVFIYRC